MKESVLESGGLFSSDDESDLDGPKRSSAFRGSAIRDSDFDPNNHGEGKVLHLLFHPFY